MNQTLPNGGFKYGAYIGELHFKNREKKSPFPLEESMIEVETLKEDSATDEGKIYLGRRNQNHSKKILFFRQIPGYSVRDLATFT